MTRSKEHTHGTLHERLHAWFHHWIELPMERLGTFAMLLYYAALMVVAMPAGYVRSRRYPETPWRGWDEIFHWVNRQYLAACDIPIVVEGKEHMAALGQPAVYAANHGSSLDGAFFQATTDRPGLAVTAPARFFPWPFSFWVQRIGAIQVARSPKEEQKYPEALVHQAVIDATVARIKRGESVLIFPEGHAQRSPHLQHFKTGAARIALAAGVPLIPVSIRGDYALWPANRPMLIHPQRVTLVFHPVANPLPAEPTLASDLERVELWTAQLLHRIAHGLEASFQVGLPECDCRDLFRPVTPKRTGIKKKRRPSRASAPSVKPATSRSTSRES